MARSNRSNNLMHSEFCKTVKVVLDAMIEKKDFESCVNAARVAAHKDIAKGFAVKNAKRLELLVLTAISCGQVEGFGARKGRNGGIHRVEVIKAKRTEKSKKPVSASVEVASNEVSDKALVANG